MKDDYFTVVYRVLTYLYECFKSGERADVATFGPDALGINSVDWFNAMESLYDEGHIKSYKGNRDHRRLSGGYRYKGSRY